MQFRIENIPLDQIDIEDITYRITTEDTAHNIEASIKCYGLINLPILYRDTSCSIIISGFRRISACLQLKWDKVKARVLDTTGDEIDRISVAISDNAFQRSLNLIEISRAYQLLSSIFDNINDIAKESSALGLPNNPDFIRKTQPLCQLPASIQQAVIKDVISLPVALELNNMTSDVSTSLAELFCDLKIGMNKQREIITLIKEIAIREDLTPSDILKDGEWVKITTHEKTDRSQRQQTMRQYLKRRRFPTISHAAASFELSKKNLNLGKRIKLSPPRNFEGNTYTFSIDFSVSK